MILFKYQINAVNTVLDKLKSSVSRVLLQSPVGSGKTVIAADLAIKYQNQHSKVLFIVNKTPLVGQSYNTFLSLGFTPAVLHNEIRTDIDGNKLNLLENDSNNTIIISMPETFSNEDMYHNLDIKLIILDEAHKATSETYRKLTELFPNAQILGLTATPFREKSKEGETLREWYGDNLVTTITIKELIELGQLVPINYKVVDPDSKIVDIWFDLTRGENNKRTIIFTEDTNHSIQVRDSFVASGVNAELITAGDTINQTLNQRNKILKDYKDGKIEVLISVMALCEGFDERLARYCFILRSVGSVSPYQQMGGRVARSHPQKSDCYIVDFGNNVDNYGFLEDWEWDLDDENQLTKYETSSSINLFNYNRYKKIYIKCSDCHHVYDGKKHYSCTKCNSSTNLKIIVGIETLKDRIYSKMNPILLKQFKSANNQRDLFPELIKKIKYAKDKNQFKLFNNKFFELFDDSGNFIQEFVWMNKLLGVKYKTLDEKLEIQSKELCSKIE